MIEVFIVVPKSIRMPKKEFIFRLFPVRERSIKLPDTESGRDRSRSSGILRDSNWAPKIRYIRITASRKTNPISLRLLSRAEMEVSMISGPESFERIFFSSSTFPDSGTNPISTAYFLSERESSPKVKPFLKLPRVPSSTKPSGPGIIIFSSLSKESVYL
ncbi:hypothetical protein ES705_49881 [subsurface metagenome]